MQGCNMANFTEAYILTVIGNEGGYRNVSWDKGGETYRGISRVYHPSAAIWTEIDKRKPIAEKKVFSDLEPLVKDFYAAKFWDRMKGAQIKNQALANYMFDYIVQSGTDEIRHIKECINLFLPNNPLTVNDYIDTATLAALDQVNTNDVYNCLKQQREDYYKYLLSQGILSQNDWQGILNRLAKYDWLEAGKKGVSILAIAATTYLSYRLIKYLYNDRSKAFSRTG